MDTSTCAALYIWQATIWFWLEACLSPSHGLRNIFHRLLDNRNCYPVQSNVIYDITTQLLRSVLSKDVLETTRAAYG